MQLGQTAMIVLALVAGFWLAVALWATLRGMRRAEEAVAMADSGLRHEALLAASPAAALIVGANGLLDGDERAAPMLGLSRLPERWTDLRHLLDDAAPDLDALISDAATGGVASFSFTPAGSARVLKVEAGPAPAAL